MNSRQARRSIVAQKPCSLVAVIYVSAPIAVTDMRRTVSGLMKILHPHGEVSRDDLEETLALAVEGRRRVKEQLKKMGSFEYHHTSFSYSVNETGEERFVGVQSRVDGI
jgi:predicted ATP-dependent Lon-type protease